MLTEKNGCCPWWGRGGADGIWAIGLGDELSWRGLLDLPGGWAGGAGRSLDWVGEGASGEERWIWGRYRWGEIGKVDLRRLKLRKKKKKSQVA